MSEKSTRILEIEVTRGKVLIVGDVYVQGNLLNVFSSYMEIEIRGNLWIDGNMKMESCKVTAESIEVGGNCSCKSLISTKGSIKISGEENNIQRINSYKDIDIKGCLNGGGYYSNGGLRANGQIRLSKCCGYDEICAKQNVTIKFVIATVNIKGKNVNIEEVGYAVNQICAEDSIYLQSKIEEYYPKLKAKKIIIDN